ncbi:transcription factor atf-2-like [Lytechinus pictus]|uniref:transcription factor atf-2-like n=1 Tax=Lytechinus pictus TaxID=7653 RepID=UPI0030BA0B1E
MEDDIVVLETIPPKYETRRNGLHCSKLKRPHQAVENLKTSSPLHQRPVQMVYPAVQKTSEDHRIKISVRMDSDAEERSSTSDSSEMDDPKDTRVSKNLMGGSTGRQQRDFVPESTKNEKYWVKRIKNNLSAKRSREKRRMADILMESKVSKLAQENEDLRSELANIKRLVQDSLVKEPKQLVAIDVRAPPQGPQKEVVGAPQHPVPLVLPTYQNPLSKIPTPPQEIVLIPQSGVSQSLVPQPVVPQSIVAQPGIPQTGIAQSGLMQPSLPRSIMVHPGLPQSSMVQPGLQQIRMVQQSLPQTIVAQPNLQQSGLPQYSLPRPCVPRPDLQQSGLPYAVQSVAHPTLSHGSGLQVTPSSENVHPYNRPEFENHTRRIIPRVPSLLGRTPVSSSQGSTDQSSELSSKETNGVTKVRSPGVKLKNPGDVPLGRVSERAPPLDKALTRFSKPTATDLVATSPHSTSSETSETSLAEINKLPHKLRARFLRSLGQQEEGETTNPEAKSSPKEPTPSNDPILMNIKQEKDEIPQDDGEMEIDCVPSVPLNVQWVPPKTEFHSNPLKNIDDELEQARKLMPYPSPTMNRAEAQAYVELAKAASDLVGARLQLKDFSAPSVRQLTRQRTRDMNQIEKYRDKRVRNNIAAKKCRDAKRLLNDYRTARSNFFEVENVTLRNEVEVLTKDVMRLRELVRNRQLTQ